MTVSIHIGTTDHYADWESLCLYNGHFLASHYNDAVNAVYNIIPCYILVLDNDNRLAGGCKIHLSQSKRMPYPLQSISRTASLFGEYLVSPSLPSVERKEVIGHIHDGVRRFLNEQGVVSLLVYGHYGDEQLLYPASIIKKTKPFNIGLIDLRLNTETLWNNIHSKHRNVIRKAEKDDVKVISNGNYADFKNLLKDTYSRQKAVKGPDDIFLDSFYKVVSDAGQCRIYNAYYNNILTGSVLIHTYGTWADYAFAGSHNIHNGANTLLQWHIIRDLKAQGYTTYNLGEIADEKEDYDNEKYSGGISRFKLRMGCSLKRSYYGTYITSPFKHTLWKSLVYLRNKI